MLYAIGDIHGRLDLLHLLRRMIINHAKQYDEEHTVVFLGDYIDRGPNSKEVVEYIRSEPFSGFKHVPLLGNHEEMMIDSFTWDKTAIRFWLENGGDATVRSYQMNPFNLFTDLPLWTKVAKDDVDWFKTLPYTHLEGNFLFVHAGIMPGLAVNEHTNKSVFLWIRDKFLAYDGPHYMNENNHHEVFVVHGHTPMKTGSYEYKKNRLNLDTGSNWTNNLTAAIIDVPNDKVLGLLQTTNGHIEL